ncbi:MAG: UvrD-helicase domain-containing protein [Planctomycetes bacterium]|nr:UvrD-helicase domain-containing protein [Planctomycetota bacterium]MCW8137212.1 UvrD-helicase domain-containing protein [Planctomycetota bacterium]
MSAPDATGKLNPGQRAALDLQRDMLVSAGAGAGKTQVLGLRTIALLEGGHARIDEIVAFTFTEKAAAEMRQRVQELLLKRIAELGNGEPRERLLAAQAEFSRNRISTVHSFCYRLLRDYAWEAGLEPNASILDERRQQSARDSAIDSVLLRADFEADPALAGALSRLATALTLRELRECMHMMLSQRHLAAPALATARKGWADPEAELQRRRARHAAALREAMEPVAQALATIDFAAVRAAKAKDALRELALEVSAERDAAGLASLLLTKGRQPRSFGNTGAAGNWKHNEDALQQTRAALSRAALAMKAVQRALPLSLDEAFERRSGEVLCDLGYVLDRVADAYVQACAGGLDFLDLELKSLGLLRDNPDIHAEVLRRVRHVLVDEYQDTNPTQAELFALLAPKGAAPGRFFAVGDAKQSVYGFRGSDVSIFNRALHEVPARNAASGADRLPMRPPWGLTCDDTPEQRSGIVRLAHNYRTVEPLLELGNAIFRRVFEVPNPQPHDALPQDMVAGVTELPDGPHAELHWLPRKGASKDVGNDDDDGPRRDDEAEFVARRVADLRDRGTALEDIAILVRRSTRNPEYRAAFARHDLPLLLTGQAGLFDTLEGCDCYNLLRCLANPGDDVAMLGLLRSPLAGLTDAYLTGLALTHGRDLPLYRRLTLDAAKPPEAADFQERFEALRMRAGREAPALLLSEALADAGYALAIGCGFDAQQRLANLERILEVVRQLQVEHPALATLVRELGRRIEGGDPEAQGSPDSHARGVRLITVHRAKGLEFKVVIVPDIAGGGAGDQGPLRAWPEPGESPGLWLRSTDEATLGNTQGDLYAMLQRSLTEARAAAESRRVLYVAFTRAKEKLILVGTASDEFSSDHWADMLAAALGLRRWGDATPRTDIEMRWHTGVERSVPRPHSKAISNAQQALQRGSLPLPVEIDTSLRGQPGAAAGIWIPPRAAEFGTLVHEAMERAMRRKGAEAGLVGVGGEQVRAHVRRALESLETLGPARRILPEFGVLTPRGTRRLDLLRQSADGQFQVIDYKTDRVQGDLHEHAIREYAGQLADYARSLHRMLGQPVRAFVCFTAQDDLQPRQRLVEIPVPDESQGV